MKKLVILFLALCCGFVSCRKGDPDPEPLQPGVFQLGAILDLSGDYSEAGRTGKAAIELAINGLNERYQSINSNVRFACTFIDTHLDTVLTKEAARDLYDQGVRVLVAGPNNSAGLKVISSFINNNHMLAVTCFSSSPSLAVADDYIYRLITDDNAQTNALVSMMRFDTVKAAVVIWRDDTYGSGLQQAVVHKLEMEGCHVFPGIAYAPDAPDYEAVVAQVAAHATEAIAQYGASHVSVLLISYQEATGFLRAAAAFNQLSLVRWYGCDANAQRVSVSEDPVAGSFAASVRFLAPIMGIGTAGNLPPTAQELSYQIFSLTGLNPDAYALSAYDAVQVVAQAYDIVQNHDATKLKMVIPSVCESYDYLGISRKLNVAGDLASANYIFWTVVPQSGTFIWDSYATYIADGDYIQLKQ